MADTSVSKYECPICLEDVKAPKLLPCFHSMCFECLKSYISDKARFGRFPCPVCKTTIKTPSRGAQDFQSNFYIPTDATRSPNTSKTPLIICDVCSDSHAAASRCRTCKLNLCESCCKHHSRLPATREHALSAVKQNVFGTEDSHSFLRAGQQFVSGFGGHMDISEMYKDMFSYLVYNSLMLVKNPATDSSRKLWALERIHEAFRKSQDHRDLAGSKLELVKEVIELISQQVEETSVCDDIMLRLWSMIVSLLDNSKRNSALFISHKGLEQVVICTTLFQNDRALVSDLALTMGNLAEWKDFRHDLMEKTFVEFFGGLVRRENVDNVTKYASLAFLVHLTADGEDQWLLQDEKFTYDEIVNRIYSVLDDWPDNIDTSVAFRSLQPMLEHVQNFSNTISQYWAAWSIYNKILCDPKRYCELLWKEEGQEILQLVVKQQRCNVRLQGIIHKILLEMT